MTTSRSLAPMLPVLFLLLPALWLSSCHSGTDAGELAGELADRLTDALEFEDGEYEDSQPPKGEAGSGAPQIVVINGPDSFRLGASFSVGISSAFEQPEKVDKVIVQVVGASGYIAVPAALFENLVTLFGTLKGDPTLQGMSFTLNFALQTSDGRTGLYRPTNFAIPDEPPQELSEPVDTVAFGDNATLINEEAPRGSGSDTAAQIKKIEGPDLLLPGNTFTIDLFTDYQGSTPIISAIMTLPNSTSYFDVEGSLIDTDKGRVMRVEGTLDAEKLSAGDVVTFMFALKTEDGTVGLYRGWSIVIGGTVVLPDGDQGGDSDLDEEVAPESDGDQDLDVDSDPDTDTTPLDFRVQPAFLYPTALVSGANLQTRMTLGPTADGLIGR